MATIGRIAKCKRCGKRIVTKSNHHLYCYECGIKASKENSKRHYEKRRGPDERPIRKVACCVCGEIFETKNTKAVTCPKCRANHHGNTEGSIAAKAKLAELARARMKAGLAKRDAEYAAKFGNKGRIVRPFSFRGGQDVAECVSRFY